MASGDGGQGRVSPGWHGAVSSERRGKHQTLAGDENICLMKLYARENFCVNKINFKHGRRPWAAQGKPGEWRWWWWGVGFSEGAGVNEFIPGD